MYQYCSNFLLATLISLLFVNCNFTKSETNQETDKSALPPPNIVWIVSEDNSPFLGCYGDKSAITPNIDQLAENGLLYKNAFANAPVCAPSRSTLITGMYPTSLGSQHMRSQVDVPNYVKFFPQYLKDAGYYTTLRVKRDYNIPKQNGTWDKDDFWAMKDALTDKKDNQPFFMFYNTWMSHESKLFDRTNLLDYFKGTFGSVSNIDSLLATFHDFSKDDIVIPPYQPTSPATKDDWSWYYKAMQMMDFEVGSVINHLSENNLLENTIIIYSSDHGGVLGRSKRFNFDSGLQIPMIIVYPKKYQHLATQPMGTTTNNLVSFVDMAPTILSMANIVKPDHMHGTAFAGLHIGQANDISYGFRGRMDEAYDMVRTIRDKKYRYIKNYMPYRPNGQHIEFLWKAKSMVEWSKSYQNGECNAAESVFFEPRQSEELYDIVNDPHNVVNLATDKQYNSVIKEYRKANNEICKKYLDGGFFPEGELWQRSQNQKLTYNKIINNNKKECLLAIESAENATLNPSVNILAPMLKSPFAAVRFWGATGCIILGQNSKPLLQQLLILSKDSSEDVAVTSAEALYLIGNTKTALKTLSNALNSNNEYVRLRALNVISSRNIKDQKIIQKIKGMDQENEYIKKLVSYITH
ncbi:MAG: sulfatase-like hydrolase/transferase [Saprospiraceae bacterium]